ALILIIAGVVMVVFKRGEKSTAKRGALLWQLIGFSGGAVFAMQPPMNNLLSASLSSAVHAAFVSFFTATAVLLVIVLSIRQNREHIPQIFSLNRPWWSWLGGIIGGVFVTGFAYFAGKIGVGVLLVTSICGMLTISLFIDKYGWLGANKRKIGLLQYAGVLLIAAGVALLRLN
ncbi:MAG: DMT family transporter, partial [Muribaculaceae bacterium]|nr:DMT family transporter [Muribaculaceae bacterium]